MIFWKRVQIFASYKKLSGSILCVILKKLNGSIHNKNQFCEFFLIVKNFESWKKKSISLNQFFFFSKKFKYLSHVKKKVQFFESCEKGASIWIMKKKKEQFFESNWAKKKVQFFESYFQQKKKQSFEWYRRRVLCFNSLSVFWKKKAQYLKSLSKIEFCGANFQIKLNYWNLMKKSTLWVMFKKGSNICLIFSKKVNSLGHIKKKGSTLQNILKNFNPLSHSEKVLLKKMVNSSSHMLKLLQFFESNWKEGFHSVSHINRKGSILWVIAFQKKFNSWVIFFEKGLNAQSHVFEKDSLNHIEKISILWVSKKRVQFVESYSTKKSSILRVLSEKGVQFFESRKKSSVLCVSHIFKRVNSLSHTPKSQFFES